MKILITTLSFLAIFSSVFAASPELTSKNSGIGNAFVYTGGIGQASIRIDGEAARVLFMGLEVQSENEFGFVQTQTKKTDKVECVQSILGDVPGQMSGAHFSCSILVDKI